MEASARRGLVVPLGLALALSACSPGNTLDGNVGGKPPFRPAGALFFSAAGTAVEMSNAGSSEECAASNQRTSVATESLLLSRLPSNVGVRGDVITDRAARIGGAGTTVFYFKADGTKEVNWTGWVEVSTRTGREVSGKFEISAGESYLNGSFSAVACF